MEGISNSILDLFSKLGVQFIGLVGKLNTFHPEFHLRHASIKQVIKLSSCIEKARHDRDKYRVVAETDKFKNQCHKILTGISTGIVTIADCCQSSECPVKRENVSCSIALKLRCIIFIHEVKVIHIQP